MSKHYEVNFNDGTIETVMSPLLPPDIEQPMFMSNENEIVVVPAHRWWTVTLLTVSTDKEKLVPFGRVHVNLDNVTFIKEC